MWTMLVRAPEDIEPPDVYEQSGKEGDIRGYGQARGEPEAQEERRLRRLARLAHEKVEAPRVGRCRRADRGQEELPQVRRPRAGRTPSCSGRGSTSVLLRTPLTG